MKTNVKIIAGIAVPAVIHKILVHLDKQTVPDAKIILLNRRFELHRTLLHSATTSFNAISTLAYEALKHTLT